jgi:tetratricopeptide (TPR) repeat protein
MTVTDINAERFFRQACDYFYFLDNPRLAIKCLDKSLNITQNFPRAWNLKGEIMLYTDKLEDAKKCFLKVEKTEPLNFRNLANIASCCEMLEDWQNALKYCNLAIDNFNEENDEELEFLSSLYELKISLLVKSENIHLAKQVFNSLDEIIFGDDLKFLKSNYGWLKKRNTEKNI